MSYVNLIMFNAVLPSYDTKKYDKKNGREEVINASDPKNKDKVHKIMFGD